MSQGVNDQSGVHAGVPHKAETGFTAEPPAPAVGVHPRIRWVRLSLILSVVLAVVGIAILGATGVLQYVLFGFPTTPMTEEKANQMALAGPPPGSTLAEVEGWLASRGIMSNPASPGPNYTVMPYREDPGGRRSMDGVGHHTVAECAGLRTEDVDTYIRVVYPDADRYFMGQDRTTIYFFFDAKGRLLRHWVEVFHVMP
jgi:hypothetical protein